MKRKLPPSSVPRVRAFDGAPRYFHLGDIVLAGEAHSYRLNGRDRQIAREHLEGRTVLVEGNEQSYIHGNPDGLIRFPGQLDVPVNHLEETLSRTMYAHLVEEGLSEQEITFYHSNINLYTAFRDANSKNMAEKVEILVKSGDAVDVFILPIDPVLGMAFSLAAIEQSDLDPDEMLDLTMVYQKYLNHGIRNKYYLIPGVKEHPDGHIAVITGRNHTPYIAESLGGPPAYHPCWVEQGFFKPGEAESYGPFLAPGVERFPSWETYIAAQPQRDRLIALRTYLSGLELPDPEKYRLALSR